jgi:hypothetical protein
MQPIKRSLSSHSIHSKDFSRKPSHKPASVIEAHHCQPHIAPASSGLAQRLSLKLINMQETSVLALSKDLRCREGVNVAAVLASGFKALLKWQVTDLEMDFLIQMKSSHVGMRV